MKNDSTYYTLDRIEEGIQYMIQNFFEHEVMGKTRKIKGDRVAVEDISKLWRELLKQSYSIACFKEGCNDIIAMNVLTVKNIDEIDDPIEIHSQNLKDMFGVMEYASKQFNPFDNYQVNKYLIAYGLCVDTSYRGRGIATEMLKAGYETNFEITYDDLYKYNSDFYFPGIAAKSFKTMSLVIQ